MNQPLVATSGLTKKYGAVKALAGTDLALYPGQIVGLLGENGCGKTTLLKVLGGVLNDYQGEVKVAGYKPGPESKAVTSFLPDVSYLRDGMRISQAVELFTDFFPDFNADKAADSINFFGFDSDMRLREMSKGMREKVQVALAMSRDAKVFLLDEPISGVDPAAREIILQGIVRNLEPDALVFISTHLVHDLEPVLDGVVMMRYGKTLLSGSVDELRAEHNLSIDALFRKVYSWSQN